LKPITIFQGSSGLNIVDDPVRIEQTRGGRVDLQVAVNVFIDQSGRVLSRRGTSLLQSGSYHSLFCDGGDCFVIQGDTMYRVAEDGSLSSIKTGLHESRMSYAQAGDRTYYANGFDRGIIYQGAHEDWTAGTYVGPDTHRQFTGPVTGNHLAVYFGRMLIAVENVLWWSEPYNFGLYDPAASFVQFHTKIRMMKPVDGGLYLSTEKKTYFLAGRSPLAWVSRTVCGYPAIDWAVSGNYMDGADLGLDPGQYAVWASREGAILGSPDGAVRNLNKRKIIYPEEARTGFGELIGTNFIHGVE
jgi:hypothetical protein